jgi:hypothetical protein
VIHHADYPSTGYAHLSESSVTYLEQEYGATSAPHSRLSNQNMSLILCEPCARLCISNSHYVEIRCDPTIEIIFHGERFPELPTSTGALLQIVAIHTDNTVRDFHTGAKSTSQYATQHRTDPLNKDTHMDSHSKKHRRDSITITIDENGSIIPGGREIDAKRAYVFVPRALPADLKSIPTYK